MFILHSSNKTENLIEHLATVIETAPLSSPFAKEVFLIQSQGMERWLSQQLASRFQVWGNYEYLFPGRFFSSLAEKVASATDNKEAGSPLTAEAFDRHLLLWRFEALLRQLDNDLFLPLQHYLAGENTGLKRYQLAQQLAQVFDQYQMMRPQMLSTWQQGRLLDEESDIERWQRALWQQLTSIIGDRHRGSLWLDIIERLNNTEPGGLADCLPERVSVFGLNTMPPLFLAYLQGLAKHIQVHFYLLNPAQVFWADLQGKRQQLNQQIVDAHPLLVSLAQQGREFQQIILEQARFELELDSFEPEPVHNNLQQLQNDILNNQLSGQTLIKDDSIRIHACHSRMREVEVVKNQLLQVLEADTELQLRDIVVMAPDIESYEPFISAVFADIQHAVADRSLKLSNSALDAFIRFLALSKSRFGWQAVMDLLEQPVVYPGFGLSETDLDRIKHWVQATNVRWGQSGQHKKVLGLPEINENTWQAALDRLLMGYAMGSDEEFVDGVLPFIELEGSSAQALGSLHDFMQLLFSASKQFAKAKSLRQWSQLLSSYVNQLLDNASDLDKQGLNELLLELGDRMADVHEHEVELEVIIAWLESRVSESKSSNGFLRGQLTFCSMLPMRSIPFKVVALLGMNEGEFPKIDRAPTFDLLAQHFQLGDRSRRADDRYQFLEVLLSTRQQLIMTYLGQSINSNETVPPSVVISELLDVLKMHYQLTDLVIYEPLQSFSSRYFNATEGLINYSQSDFDTAQAMADNTIEQAAWWQGEITEETGKQLQVIEVSELLAFYQHPQKYFLQQKMALRFDQLNADAEEREVFTVDGLDAYGINQQWLEARLKGEPFPLAKLCAQGQWLAAVPGQLQYEKQQNLIDAFVARIQEKQLGSRQEDLVLDISVGNYRVIGKLTAQYEYGSLFYRYAALKGKDVMTALLHHLLFNQLKPQATHLISSDRDILWQPEHASLSSLLSWLDIYQQGQQRPDAFFTEAAFAYVIQSCSSRAKVAPVDKALEVLQKSLEKPYEPALRQLLLNTDLRMVLNQDFEKTCQTLLLPIWEVAHVQA